MNEDDMFEGHKIEQSMQQALDHLPGYYWSLFTRYRQAGFNEDQAFRLILAAIASTVRL